MKDLFYSYLLKTLWNALPLVKLLETWKNLYNTVAGESTNMDFDLSRDESKLD